MVEVLLFADLSRWPIIHSTQSQTAQATNYAPSSAMMSPMGGLWECHEEGQPGERPGLHAVNQIITRRDDLANLGDQEFFRDLHHCAQPFVTYQEYLMDFPMAMI